MYVYQYQNLAECILESQKDLRENNVVAPMVGHVGDGNFHLLMLCNPNDKNEIEKT